MCLGYWRKGIKMGHLPKEISVGPGGIKCACCFPPPGSKSRRKAIRSARRQVKAKVIKYEIENMDK